MRKAISLTGDDTQGGVGKVGTIRQITTRRSSVGIPHLVYLVEEGSSARGDREPPNVPKPPFMWERESVGRNGGRAREKEREREREREGRREERERGREGERDLQSKSRGLTGTVGGWWV